jgi:putative transposase
MGRGKQHTAEQIVNLLRQVEVGVENGKSLAQACKESEIVEHTYYRWRKEFGGLKVDQARASEGAGAGEREAQASGFGVEPGEAGVKGHRLGKLLSPERRHCAVSRARHTHGLSERRACRVVKQPRGTQRYRPTQRDDEDTLTQAIVTLASQYGCYGYRRITRCSDETFRAH